MNLERCLQNLAHHPIPLSEPCGLDVPQNGLLAASKEGRREGGKLSSLFLQGSKILSAQSANLEVHGIRRGNSGAHVMRAQSMNTHSEMPKSGYESVFACKTSDFEHQIRAREAVVKLLRLQSWLRE